jgi:hypothetical protein
MRDYIKMLTARLRSYLTFSILTLMVSPLIISLFSMVWAEDLAESQKILKSASELDYPPFAIVHPDGTAGCFSVELLKAATEAVDLSVSFKVGPWNELKQQLAERSIDVLPFV